MERQYRTVILGNCLVFRNPNVCLMISKSPVIQPYNGCFSEITYKLLMRTLICMNIKIINV